MKKVIFILLIFLAGCIPMPGQGDFSQVKEEKEIKLRGLDVEFNDEDFHFSYLKDEKLPVLWSEESFSFSVRITNHMLKDIEGEISVSSLSLKNGKKIIKRSDSLEIESAELEQNKVFPSVKTINFGPFIYNEDEAGDDGVVTNIKLNYNGLITGQMCFGNENSRCNNYETFDENKFLGDAGYIPVSISEVRKEAVVRDNIVKVRLLITFNNFNSGTIAGNKLNRFNAKIGNTYLECAEGVFFKDNEANIICNGDIGLDSDEVMLPVEFELEYKYEISRIINYVVQ